MLPLVCVMVLLIGINVSASGYGSDINFCHTCGASLTLHSSLSGRWTSSHYVKTDYVNEDGSSIYQNCQVGHEVFTLGKVCPTHGTMWSANEHHENHSSSYCNDVVYYE